MKNLVSVEIINIEGLVFKGQARQVVVPCASGDIGVLPNHEQFVAELREGEVRILDNEDRVIKDVAVKSGTAEFYGDEGLRVLIDS